MPMTRVVVSLEHQQTLCWHLSGMTWPQQRKDKAIAWWRHQMETFSTLLALCAGNSPVTGEFPSQRPVTRSFDVFFDLRLNKRLSKQSWGWWFETPLRSLWRQRNGSWNVSTCKVYHNEFITSTVITLSYKAHIIRQYTCWSLRCSWSIADVQLNFHSRLSFNGLGKDSFQTRREIFRFWYLVRIILDVYGYSV